MYQSMRGQGSRNYADKGLQTYRLVTVLAGRGSRVVGCEVGCYALPCENVAQFDYAARSATHLVHQEHFCIAPEEIP